LERSLGQHAAAPGFANEVASHIRVACRGAIRSTHRPAVGVVVTTTALQPGVVTCLDDMLSGVECADILEELKYSWWWSSPLVQIGPDGALVSRRSYRRTSSTTSEEWMGERTVQLLRRLEEDLHRVAGLRPDHLEHWQAVRYRRGERFDEHHDAGFFASDPDGERTNSVVVYRQSLTA
jgi:hypothetical protein